MGGWRGQSPPIDSPPGGPSGAERSEFLLPEQVAAITAQYAPELAALAAQLAALEADAPTGA